ncbi:hypothetical protein BSM4216_2612 [Bacillus smithii]|nr:hypothetical protein BSM4216_2612 [Bacillus smithii]
MNGRVDQKAALFQIMRFVGSSEEAKRNLGRKHQVLTYPI